MFAELIICPLPPAGKPYLLLRFTVLAGDSYSRLEPMRHIFVFLSLWIFALGTPSIVAAATASDSILPVVGEINDRQVTASLTARINQMIQAGQTTTREELASQLDRKECELQLVHPGKRRLSAAQINEKYRAGVVVVAQPYLCGKCDRTHLQLASGFMLTPDGAFCTSHHIMNNRTTQTMVIVTGDGRVAPVREVLAANANTDLLILRAEGSGYQPLPLATHAPIGSTVRIISHPNNRFYSLTEGIVSRHFALPRRRQAVSMLAVTADFAKGSSGAPVFNESGAVVASVNSTISSYYDTNEDGHQENLQMVFKNCVSARHVLELIRTE